MVANDLGGVFPQTPDELQKLPGIGRYTAAAIGAIAFNHPSTVVDGNVERVMARVYAVTDPLPGAKQKLYDLAHTLSDGRADRPGDYAQALMDLGSMICTPRSPKCPICPVRDMCAGRSIAETLPRKSEKKAKPQRYGHAFWITDDAGRVLVEKRPATGLYGGMTALPTTTWSDTGEIPASPAWAKGLDLTHDGVFVRHSLTHFDLQLDLWQGAATRDILKKVDFDAAWIGPGDIDDAGFPTLFRKLAKLMK